MAAPGTPERPDGKRLMATMTSSAALPAFVPKIDPHTLKHLVDDVGLEDAGPLIAHASQRQLVHLLDETLWTGARPGDPDKLSVAELLRWLDLWNGLGEGFVADKLYELGDDFCALAFSRLLLVADYDMAPRVLDEFTHAIGRYVVRVRVDDEWDAVQTAVTALWRDFPDFCEAVFARLAFRHSVLKMAGEDDTAKVLDGDASHAHERGREESGYVTSVMAGSFLRALGAADVDELAEETGYDLQTTEYFRRRAQLKAAAAQAPAADGGNADTDDDPSARGEEERRGKDERRGEEKKRGEEKLGEKERREKACTEPDAAGAGAGPGAPAAVDPAELRGLEAELLAYERAQLRPAALLTGPETAEVKPSDWVRVALGRLQADPESFDARMDELTYLSNLVMAGLDQGGDRLESGAAANLVIATCNLGAGHELWLDGEIDGVAAVHDILLQEPGLVRLFRIGWHLLANLPLTAARRLKALFADEATRERLAAKPWVLSEVDALLGAPDFEEVVAAREFEDAQETLKILGIALEPEAVVALCVLTDGVPRFARVLEDRAPTGAVMTYAARDLMTMTDLMTVHRFLDSLEEQVRL